MQIILGDTCSALLAGVLGDGSVYADRRLVITAIGFGALLPMCFAK